MLAADDWQVIGFRAGRDHNGARPFELVVADGKLCGPDEPRHTVERLDAGAYQAGLALLWHRIRKRSLEMHQLGPVDRETVRTHALARQRACRIDRSGGTDKHFLRITSAERARPAERPLVDHGHRPSRCSA